MDHGELRPGGADLRCASAGGEPRLTASLDRYTESPPAVTERLAFPQTNDEIEEIPQLRFDEAMEFIGRWQDAWDSMSEDVAGEQQTPGRGGQIVCKTDTRMTDPAPPR